MKKQEGFSLVEMMVVMAIVVIVSAIAVPKLLTSKQAANEAAAIQGCRTMASAQLAFSSTNNQMFTDVTSLVSSSYLDGRFSTTGPINGYLYEAGDVSGTTLDGSIPTAFGFIASPGRPGLGRFLYSIGSDQVVRWQGTASGATLPPGVSAGDPIGKSS